MSIGHGHESVIVARRDGSPDMYFTDKRTWSSDPRMARLFVRASDAYKKSAGAHAGKEYRVVVEGIFTPAFGHV